MNLLTKIPTKINPCSIFEAIVEIRFAAKVMPDTIFGMLYPKFADKYPQNKIEKLPVLQIPDEIRSKDPALKYNPYYRLKSDKYLLQIGPQVISIACPKEYVGWDNFLHEIRRVFEIVKQAQVVEKIERLGLRYINYFDFNIFDNIVLKVEFEGLSLGDKATYIRSEIPIDSFLNVLQIANKAIVEGDSNTVSVIDIDTAFLGDDISFEQLEKLISDAHNSEKKLFFSLLKPEYLLTLSPEY